MAAPLPSHPQAPRGRRSRAAPAVSARDGWRLHSPAHARRRSARSPARAGRQRPLPAGTCSRCLRRDMACGLRPVMSRPRNDTLPPLGLWTPVTTLNKVVFPEPFGPTTPRISPSSMARSTPDNAVTPPNRLLNPRISRIGLIAALPKAWYRPCRALRVAASAARSPTAGERPARRRRSTPRGEAG